ncbi:tetratricopeptide repeat protein [Striga asiatica]|uniref:Tetratricopeptide repeat protein n=1 Tax=Striga asiatica TaxID=4170 RepID=A0A5A7QB61_STRAF|nr:tetratricopeptide repeat protein [Striga asiatica]
MSENLTIRRSRPSKTAALSKPGKTDGLQNTIAIKEDRINYSFSQVTLQPATGTEPKQKRGTTTPNTTPRTTQGKLRVRKTATTITTPATSMKCQRQTPCFSDKQQPLKAARWLKPQSEKEKSTLPRVAASG